MNAGIFLIHSNEELVEMNEQPLESEKLLQNWLAKYPALLVGNQIDAREPRRWLLIEQECRVPSEEGGGGRWAVDHLFLDQEAIPTFVEVKRRSDTRTRRAVVGQMLDYAANAAEHWPVTRMQERFDANCTKTGLDPEERLNDLLAGEIEPDEFWRLAGKNLKERRLRLLFVADKIPPELQSIVEFLNEQMDRTEVLAIEIKQVIGPRGFRSLVPRVIGQTTKAQEAKLNGPRTKTTEAEFFDQLRNRPADEQVARKLLEWSREQLPDVRWRASSFVPVLEYGAEFSHNPIAVYAGGKVPRVQIKFGRMKDKNKIPDEKRNELLRRLNNIHGVSLRPEDTEKFPSIELSALGNADALEQFIQAIEWVNKEVKAKR